MKKALVFFCAVFGASLAGAEKIGGDELFCIGRRHGYHRKDPAELLACHEE